MRWVMHLLLALLVIRLPLPRAWLWTPRYCCCLGPILRRVVDFVVVVVPPWSIEYPRVLLLVLLDPRFHCALVRFFALPFYLRPLARLGVLDGGRVGEGFEEEVDDQDAAGEVDKGVRETEPAGWHYCGVGVKGTVEWDEILTLSEGIVQPYGCFLILGDDGLVKKERFGI